ncbi:MAG: GAF domain-containing protein [Anaerolineae bacterium]|nr:GAF domain-containing protein [Anaerolineae bacterium]
MLEKPQATLTLLYNISRELATSLDLNTVLGRILVLSTSNVGAERASLIALNEHQSPIAAALVFNNELIPATVEQLQAILDHGLAGWVLRHHQAVLIKDTSSDERWFRRPDDDVNQSGAKSAICIPLVVGAEQIVGVLTIVHPVPGFFNDERFALLQAIADQAGIAIYNALLYKELQASNHRYRELFEASVDPILISDWKGNILEANRRAAMLTGIDVVELSMQTVFKLHQLDWDWLDKNISVLHENKTLTYESLLCMRDGNKIPIEVYVHKVNIEGGEYLQWILRDISDRKAFETLREDLYATIYHDLRAPLSNIISSLDVLASVVSDCGDETMKQLVSIGTRSAERLHRLISSLLDINRLETGKSIIRPKPQRIYQLVEDSIDTVLPNAAGKEQTISRALDDGLPMVMVDEEMIRRVIINLLENAIKYSPPKTEISVGAKLHDGWVLTWIQDHGPGIPEDAREKIFEKYTRLKIDGVPKGIGLGLSFCRLALEAHGGKIWVEGGEETGSRFMFLLPVAS